MLHERLEKALEKLGFHNPTPVQEQAIPALLEGGDWFISAQTGSGKTAAFLLPLLQRMLEAPRPDSATRALILLPTRELAVQTQENLQKLAQFTFIKSALIIGGEDFKKQAASLRKNPEFVIGTPGRLLEHAASGHLELQDLEFLVFDEADRMLDMGFAEDVTTLAKMCNAERQTLLFSATTGSALNHVIAEIMREPQRLAVNTVQELSASLSHHFITVDDDAHKEKLIIALLNQREYSRAIVFTNTRLQADRLGGLLVAAHQAGTSQAKVFVLHGEKDHKDRRQAINRLNQGHINVLIATDVAARGLDIHGMDLVINFDVPRRGDDYVHRTGRTGRAGNEGTAISLVDHYEWNLLASIQRYLKLPFEKMLVPGLKGNYSGPKKVKSSGKAAGKKKSKDAGKSDTKKAAKKSASKKPFARKAASERPKATAASSATTDTAKPVKKSPLRNARPKADAPAAGRDGFAPLRKRSDK